MAASLRIEGATGGLSDKQIQYIRDVLDKRGFKNNKVVIEPVGKVGDNYVANVLRISTIVEGGEDFKMIAKIATQIEAMRKAMNTADLFNNEIIMYQEVLPKLVGFQIAADVPKNDLLRYAECYGCLTEEPNEVILLEDLKNSNFEMLDRFSSLSNEAVRLLLKNFAIYHSLSYVLKKKEPETYDRIKVKFFDVWNSIPDELHHLLVKMEQDAIALVDEKYKNSLRGIMSQMSVFGQNLKKQEKYSKHLVIQQGDSWTNNIMFKLEGDTPTECVMIDYQLSKETNPMCDFLYMVFNCTDHATRAKYYYDWIDYYHDQLDDSLSEFGMKANFVYPRDQLDADLKRYSKFYIGISIMLYGLLSRSTEEASVVKDAMKEGDDKIAEAMSEMKNLSLDTIKLYKSRVEDLVESCRLFGYL